MIVIRLIPSLIIFFFLSSVAYSQNDHSRNEYFIEYSDLHEFRSEKIGMDLQLRVLYPTEDLLTGINQFPVVYFVDADGTFGLVAEIFRLLQFTGEIEPAIVVGIQYVTDGTERFVSARRRFDLTPTVDRAHEERKSSDYNRPVKTGGADAYLDGLLNEIIPFIESKYPTSSEKYLSGYSLSGLLASYLLLTEPENFDGYLIGSPSLWWDDTIIFDIEQQYSDRHDDLNAKVFLSTNDQEEPYLSQMQQFAEALQKRSYPGLELKYHVFDGDSHISGIPATIAMGLMVLLHPN